MWEENIISSVFTKMESDLYTGSGFDQKVPAPAPQHCLRERREELKEDKKEKFGAGEEKRECYNRPGRRCRTAEQTPGCTRTGSVVLGKRLRLVIRLFWLGVPGWESWLTEEASDLTE